MTTRALLIAATTLRGGRLRVLLAGALTLATLALGPVRQAEAQEQAQEQEQGPAGKRDARPEEGKRRRDRRRGTDKSSDDDSPQGKPPRAKGDKQGSLERDARRQELLERYRQLSPEAQAELRKRYRERLADATPEEQARLEERHARLKEQRQDRRAKLKQQDPAKRERYRKLVQRLLEELPSGEQQRLEGLEDAERVRRLRQLLHSHRREVFERSFAQLPEELRARIEGELGSAEPRQRMGIMRREVKSYVAERLRAINAQSDLAPEERLRQIRSLIEGAVPFPEWREELLRRAEERKPKRPLKNPKRRPGAGPQQDGQGGQDGARPSRPDRRRDGARDPQEPDSRPGGERPGPSRRGGR